MPGTLPGGFFKQPPDVNYGPFDLERGPRAVFASPLINRALVREKGFKAGYRALYNELAGEPIPRGGVMLAVASVDILQFAAHDGAQWYVQTNGIDPAPSSAPVVINGHALPPAPGYSFPVPDIDGAVGTAQDAIPSIAQTFPHAEVRFAKGPYSVVVYVSGPGVTPALATEMARAEFEGLS
jgi:hypothetical protein